MHQSHPGDDVRKGFPPHEYKTGLTGVWAHENTRESIWSSLKSRCCYATTGTRMILWMSVNGHPMGSELIMKDGGSRNIEFQVNGTDRIQSVELIRNNEVLHWEEGLGKEDLSLKCVDEEDFESAALPPARWTKNPFIFYYIRARQEDGEMGWTSPVWVEQG